jgi:hypothetical protein
MDKYLIMHTLAVLDIRQNDGFLEKTEDESLKRKGKRITDILNAFCYKWLKEADEKSIAEFFKTFDLCHVAKLLNEVGRPHVNFAPYKLGIAGGTHPPRYTIMTDGRPFYPGHYKEVDSCYFKDHEKEEWRMYTMDGWDK